MPNLYDTQYPGEVAGHVESGTFLEDGVNTTRGVDIFFDGDDVPPEGMATNPESASSTAVNRRIGETVKQARERDRGREPVSVTASSWQTGNVVLADGNAFRLLIRSPNRKRVVLTNQTAGILYVGRESGLRVAGPNTVFLTAVGAVGSVREFTHTEEIWVVGVAGQIVDYVEENY